MIRLLFTCCLCLATTLVSARAGAGTVTVAVASNFQVPMQRLAERFETETGHATRLAFGSSGRLYAQIRNGAPFDLFLSADQTKPAALVEAGLALADSRLTYAIGALALWSADPARIRDGPALLASGDFQRLAIANPRVAPYGAAALELLDRLGVATAVQPKLVRGENISQAYQFVASGNAELGLVALSQIQTGGVIDDGSAWVVPADLHAPIRQDAVLLRRGADNPAARALLDYLGTPEARELIEARGYRSEAD